MLGTISVVFRAGLVKTRNLNLTTESTKSAEIHIRLFFYALFALFVVDCSISKQLKRVHFVGAVLCAVYLP